MLSVRPLKVLYMWCTQQMLPLLLLLCLSEGQSYNVFIYNFLWVLSTVQPQYSRGLQEQP